jgi:DNA-binding SARP family transcriptional activator
VLYQSQPVKFRSRKELALLIYLAVAGGRHTREKLIALLWPDSDRNLGQASLRNTLVRTRRDLGEAGAHLEIDASTLGFDGSHPVDLDVSAIESALEDGNEPADLSRLRAAVTAYRGDFLEGFSLADAPDFDG